MADDGASWAILEATSHGLAMHRLAHVRFSIAAVTNITHEHLDYHGTIDNYRRAKAILLERTGAAAGFVVLNQDDAGALAIAPFAAGANVLTYSAAGNAADIRARIVASSSNGSVFDLDAGERGEARIELPLLGDFNIANALCAAGVALAAGVTLDQIVAGLHSAPAVPGRLARVECGQPFSVVVDYAHTPDSLAKVLTLLRGLHPQGKLIAVFGSAGERDIEKRPLQGATSAKLADITVVTSEDPRFEDAEAVIAEIAAGAEAAGALPGQTLHCRTDRREAVQLALQLAEPGGCVLLAGKGHEQSIIWGRDKQPWDEASVARELLLAAGYAPEDA
jgi:UDP-N-acetylmuramoyl-L-alanyl-D-glutamate--2,6-diaminopimelate ligase